MQIKLNRVWHKLQHSPQPIPVLLSRRINSVDFPIYIHGFIERGNWFSWKWWELVATNHLHRKLIPSETTIRPPTSKPEWHLEWFYCQHKNILPQAKYLTHFLVEFVFPQQKLTLSNVIRNFISSWSDNVVAVSATHQNAKDGKMEAGRSVDRRTEAPPPPPQFMDMTFAQRDESLVLVPLLLFLTNENFMPSLAALQVPQSPREHETISAFGRLLKVGKLFMIIFRP